MEPEDSPPSPPAANKQQATQCQAVSGKGKRCSMMGQPGNEFCRMHQGA